MDSFPPIDAMSGWRYCEEGLITLSGGDWTEEVFRICWLVGYQLPAMPGCNQEHAGRFFACHTEKQLVAYLLSHHTFFDERFWKGLEMNMTTGRQHLPFGSSTSPNHPYLCVKRRFWSAGKNV